MTDEGIESESCFRFSRIPQRTVRDESATCKLGGRVIDHGYRNNRNNYVKSRNRFSSCEASNQLVWRERVRGLSFYDKVRVRGLSCDWHQLKNGDAPQLRPHFSRTLYVCSELFVRYHKRFSRWNNRQYWSQGKRTAGTSPSTRVRVVVEIEETVYRI